MSLDAVLLAIADAFVVALAAAAADALLPDEVLVDDVPNVHLEV